MVEDACLIVSELVTNAVRHGGDAKDPWVHVRVHRHALGPVIEVGDGAGERPPVLREPAAGDDDVMTEFDAETGDGCGRGLQLVAAVAADWGWRRIPETGGKTVYAILAR